MLLSEKTRTSAKYNSYGYVMFVICLDWMKNLAKANWPKLVALTFCTAYVNLVKNKISIDG